VDLITRKQVVLTIKNSWKLWLPVERSWHLFVNRTRFEMKRLPSVEVFAVNLAATEHAGMAVDSPADGLAAGDRSADLDWRECQHCLAGDGEACRRLFKRHEPRIANQMWRFSRDRAVHVELVQEVFVQAYLSLHRYRPAAVPLEHWLARIATRIGYRFWKQQARLQKNEPLTLDIPAPQSGLGDAAEAAETLHKLLVLLPAADRLVLTLMYFDDCNINQIAARTGWNRAMVKMRLFRARNRLRKIIKRKNLTEMLGAGYGSA
jgi:RNA polymerase sigma-70 factor (ECF subfamily)